MAGFSAWDIVAGLYECGVAKDCFFPNEYPQSEENPYPKPPIHYNVEAVNLSLYSKQAFGPQYLLLSYLSQFMVIVACAGNDAEQIEYFQDPQHLVDSPDWHLSFPASYRDKDTGEDFVLSVMAHERWGPRASFSNWGDPSANPVEVSAPGDQIWTTDIPGQPGFTTGDYVQFWGTSASAPFCSAAVALVACKTNKLHPEPDLQHLRLEPNAIKALIKAQARTGSGDIPGYLDIRAAVAGVQ